MRVGRQSGRRVAVGVTGLVCAGAFASGVCATSASAAQTSVTINQGNGIQGWTTPAGVSSIQLDVWGAGGGAGWGAAGPRGAGGAGAQVTATLAVSTGEWLGFGLGQAGANGSPQRSGCAVNITSDVSQGGFGGQGEGGATRAGAGIYGDFCFGGGSGGGGGDTVVEDASGESLMDVGGGGGGGGGGGIAGYAGGAGGSGGATVGDGGNGTGTGFGRGGAGSSDSGNAPISGETPWIGSSGGAGGGNGAGPNAGFEGLGASGAGGGGGGGAGSTMVGNMFTGVTIGTAPTYQQGRVVITYTTPTGEQALPPHVYTLALKRCTGGAGKQHCATQSTRAAFPVAVAATDRVSLMRHGALYAVGKRRGTRLALTVYRRITRGRYRLIVTKRPGSRHPVSFTQQIKLS